MLKPVVQGLTTITRVQGRVALVLGLCVLGIAAALYWPVIALDYVWDDNILFVDNPELRTGPIEWGKLSRPVLIGTAYFRPFVIWTFMAEFRYLGLSAAISHGINYGIYLCNLLLVMSLAWGYVSRLQLGSPAIRVAVAGLIYALHPALVESTAWVSGRFDLLATFWVLVALVADLYLRTRWARAIIVGVACLLALGSKEVAVALPLLLILQRAVIEPGDSGFFKQVVTLLRCESATVAACALAFLAYVLLRIQAMDSFVPKTNGPDVSLHGVGAQTAFSLQTLFFYVQQTLMPFAGTNMPAHPVNAARVFYPAELLKTFLALSGLFLLLIGLAKRARCSFSIASWLVCLLPVLHIISLPISNNIGCDRFLTLPLAFIAVGISTFDMSFRKVSQAINRFSGALILGTWSISAAANVQSTIPLWSDNLTLWGWIYREGVDSPNARINYTSAALREGRYDLARDVFDERLSRGALEANEQMYYGFLLAKTGEAEEGMRYLEGALAAYPPLKFADGLNGRRVSIREEYLRDRIAFGHYAMAEAKLVMQDAEGALQSIETARRYAPFAPYIALSYSLVLTALGRDDEAEAEFHSVINAAHPRTRAGYLRRRQNFLKQWTENRGQAEVGNSQ